MRFFKFHVKNYRIPAGPSTGHIRITQGCKNEKHRHKCRKFGQNASSAAAAEHRRTAAAEYDAHAFLTGLKQYQNDQKHTDDDMQRQDERLHKDPQNLVRRMAEFVPVSRNDCV